MARLCVTTKNCVFEGRVYQAGIEILVRKGRAIPSHFKCLDDSTSATPPEPKFPRCVILGDGPSRLEARQFALDNEHHADIMGVNRAGLLYPGHLTAWCSRHGNIFPEWMLEWEKLGYPRAEMVSDFIYAYPSVTLWESDLGGGSGEYALAYALHLGYQRIILAGFDLGGADGSGRSYDQYAPGFEIQKCDRVRALHGGTRKIFGLPTKGWFQNIKGDTA